MSEILHVATRQDGARPSACSFTRLFVCSATRPSACSATRLFARPHVRVSPAGRPTRLVASASHPRPPSSASSPFTARSRFLQRGKGSERQLLSGSKRHTIRDVPAARPNEPVLQPTEETTPATPKSRTPSGRVPAKWRPPYTGQPAPPKVRRRMRENGPGWWRIWRGVQPVGGPRAAAATYSYVLLLPTPTSSRPLLRPVYRKRQRRSARPGSGRSSSRHSSTRSARCAAPLRTR